MPGFLVPHATDSSLKTGRAAAGLVLMVGILLGAPKVLGASVEIAIRPTFNGEPLLLDSLRYRNAAGETLSVTRLSYLLSGFALERTDGSWLELTNEVAWMDAGQRRIAIRLEGLTPATYRGIRFHVGLDTGLNHADPAKFAADHPLNPNLNGLHWSWQGGYIFLALEGLYRSEAGDGIRGYAYHLARDPNRTGIHLRAPLDLTRDATLLLDFDLGRLLNAPRALSFARDGEATHSRDGDPVSAALAVNLPGAFRVRQIESTAPAASPVTGILREPLVLQNEAPHPGPLPSDGRGRWETPHPDPLPFRRGEGESLPGFGVAHAADSSVKPLYLPERFTPYRFQMSAVFPIPDLPRDNPLIEERVVLGDKLFHETGLSRDGTISCASCHRADAGSSDPRRFSVGVRNQSGSRHAMPLLNLAWKKVFFWDGRAPSLRAQALVPIQEHGEMDETLSSVVGKLAATGQYPADFQTAFGSPEITAEKIGLALEQFLLTLTSCDSKFDRAFRGEASLTANEQRGFELFITEYDPRTRQYGADCFHCHGGALFTDHQFHNNGLGASDADPGRFRITMREADRGKFSTPSLRNVAVRGPYMHDGRFRTLEEVVEHYATGVQRSATLDPNLAKHPDGGAPLSGSDKQALVAFLRTLTDPRLVSTETAFSKTP